MSQGHINRGLMLVKAMTKRDRADLFDELAGLYCVDCGDEVEDEEEHDCPEAEAEDEDDEGDEVVYDVIEAAQAIREAAKQSDNVPSTANVPMSLMADLEEALDALKVYEEDDGEDPGPDDVGDDGDPDDEDDEDEDGDDA